MNNQLWGYRRPDGNFGVRNYLAVVACMNSVNPTVRRIASLVPGVKPLCPGFGSSLMGEDARQYFRTMVNMCTNPNIFGVVVIGLGENSSKGFVEAIASRGWRVAGFDIEGKGGTVKTTALAASALIEMAGEAAGLQKEHMPWEKLVLGVECGSSDGSSGMVSNPVTGRVADKVVDRGGTVIMSETVEMLGAEHLLAARAQNEETRERILAAVEYCVSYAKGMNVDLLGINPLPDNIEGGLSTIEEKSLGAIKKGGSRPLVEVVDYGCRPGRNGFVIMDAPGPATENMTAISAGGAQVIIFSTGRGNTIANPISTTIKVSGNPYTVKALSDNIDVDLSAVIAKGMTHEEAAEILDNRLYRVCNGEPTKADLLNETEVAISRIARTL